MATQWVLDKISNAVQPVVHSTVSTAGSYAGGAFNAVGGTITGVGESINGAVRRYGDGVKDYGNGVLDWTDASTPRASTASNPLGLSGSKTAGKRASTQPSIYSAPKANPARATNNATRSAPKKLGAANPDTKAVGAAAKKVPVTQGKANGALRSNVPAAKPTSTRRDGAFKQSTTSNSPAKKANSAIPTVGGANKAKLPSTYKPNYTAAANPLGLK